ncbi:Hypothetical predicted protein, partial [Paramuricea clavata]
MGSRRDNDGRLNMDAVRDERDVSTQYTAEWLSNVQMPPKAHSVVQDIDEPHSPRVSRSAPALSVRSRQSNAGISRSKLQLQLRQLKEKQQLDREARYLELEMQRQELELERKRRFAEIAERKELQEMEAKLAHAELLEQFEVDSDDQLSDDGNRELNMTSHDHEGNGPYDDAERRDAERRDAEQRETERRDTERRDAERQDAEQHETERRDYPSFTTNFKTNVEDVESDPNVRRTYLIQLCTGKAKEAISGSVMLPPEEGYKKAKSILHEMFGQAHIVAASHIDR